MGLDIFFNRVHRKQIGYFRKVNFLVAYFEKKGFNVETQSDYYVYREDIEELIDICEKVLENHDLAEELLPTMSGFFFGDIDYNEYYFENVEEVLKYCKEELLPMFNDLDDGEYITFNTWY